MKAAAKLCKALSAALILLVLIVYLPITLPNFFHYDVYSVESGSMEPTINVGSIIYTKALDPASLRTGDVVLFQVAGADMPVVHRVTRNDAASRRLVTKGDANEDEDLRPIEYNEVKGKVEFHVPYYGYFADTAGTMQGKIAAAIILLCGVLLGILGNQIKQASDTEKGKGASAAVSAVALILFAALVSFGALAGYRTVKAFDQRAGSQREREQYLNRAVAGTPAPTVITPPPAQATFLPVPGNPAHAAVTPTPVTATPSPAVATTAPVTATPTPATATPKPAAPTSPPATATPAPATATPAPATDTPAPAAATPAPAAATPAPTAASPVPTAATPAPAAVAPVPAGKTTAQVSAFAQRPRTEKPDVEIEIPDVDIAKLKEAGDGELCGWIYIPDTEVNYPVYHTKDNDFYLHHTGSGAYSESGSIFLDMVNSPAFDDTHSILYGHHMANGTMFAGISKYKNDGYYEDNKYAVLITEDGVRLIEFFSGYVANVRQDPWNVDFGGEEGYAEWLDTQCKRSCFESDVLPKTGDRVITLSTCSYEFDDARFVLHGILF